MTRMIAHGIVATLLMGGMAVAQTKTITGERETKTAVIESIERSSREITLKAEDGTYKMLHVPQEVKRFDELKVGDKIKMTYYENIVLVPHQPGTPPVDTSSAKTTRKPGVDGGTKASQRTITATITEIDMKLPSVTFKGPNGWTYSSRVKDTKMLAKVKVGDQFDITWTDALLVSVEHAK